MSRWLIYQTVGGSPCVLLPTDVPSLFPSILNNSCLPPFTFSLSFLPFPPVTQVCVCVCVVERFYTAILCTSLLEVSSANRRTDIPPPELYKPKTVIMSAGPLETYNGTTGVANNGGDSLTEDLNVYYSVWLPTISPPHGPVSLSLSLLISIWE